MQRRRLPMAQHRPGPRRQDRGEPESLAAELAVADGIDATVERDQTPGTHSVPHRRAGEPSRHQLPPSNHAVLGSREGADGPIKRTWVDEGSVDPTTDGTLGMSPSLSVGPARVASRL